MEQKCRRVSTVYYLLYKRESNIKKTHIFAFLFKRNTGKIIPKPKRLDMYRRCIGRKEGLEMGCRGEKEVKVL